MAAPKNPAGGKSDKIWRDALMRAVRRESEGRGSEQWLDRIARTVVSKAVSGDVAAAKEIGDRLDGKPAQTMGIGQAEDLGPIKVSWEE